MTGFIILYGVIAVLSFLVGLALRADGQSGRYYVNERLIAWMIMLAPVWPIFLIMLIVHGYKTLYKETK